MSTSSAPDVRHTRADRVRHILLGSSLVAAPTLILIASVVTPKLDSDESAALVGAAAADPVRWQVAGVIELFGFMLLVPAVIAAAELIRSRYPGFALSTVILVSASAMMIVGAVFFTMMFASAEGLNQAAIADYLAAGEDLGAMAALIPLFFLAFIGYVLLAYGLWRTGATPKWVPALFILSFVASQSGSTGSTLVIVANLGLAIASAAMAVVFLVGEEDPAPAIAPRMKPVHV